MSLKISLFKKGKFAGRLPPILPGNHGKLSGIDNEHLFFVCNENDDGAIIKMIHGDCVDAGSMSVLSGVPEIITVLGENETFLLDEFEIKLGVFSFKFNHKRSDHELQSIEKTA